MARYRRSKHRHTTRKERNTWAAAQHVAGHWTDDKEFSERLSLVLDNLGVNYNLIQSTRKQMYSYEREVTLTLKAFGRNRRAYIFGSQIECTTTSGMMSDTDFLQHIEPFLLYLDTDNAPIQPHDHQVVIKVNTNACASQYCVLTMIEPSKQARRFQQVDTHGDHADIVQVLRTDWTATGGIIPHSIMFASRDQHPVILKQSKRHGPAETTGNMDSVYACYCTSIPKQCKFVFERPRPGHWPSDKTLKKANKYGVFIVPQGPPKSTNICTYDYFDYQWRISTNFTERLLMFSLDKVHLHAYVLSKMLRKELFVQEYQERLSTFHFKTAFFFAVENTRSDVWKEDNLYNCIKYILATLRRFLIRRNCPHFTIENVNLFDGKIDRHEFPKLVDKITNVINSLRTKIEHIHMDALRKSLNERNASKNVSALFDKVFISFQYAFGLHYSGTSVSFRICMFEDEIKRFDKCHHVPLEKYRKYAYALHSVISTLASVGASAYLEQKAEGREYNHEGISKARELFIQSVQSNIIGNYMRYVSFLFCNGEYDKACTYFDLIENQIEEDKKSNFIYQLCVSPSMSLELQKSMQSREKSVKQTLSVFLIFSQAESMCVPEFLRCEMYRRRLGTDRSSECLGSFVHNEDCICVQIEPYLYYLQYLTYRKLNQEPKQSEALTKLLIFTELIKPTRYISSNGIMSLSFTFFDTSLNMLGHCLELEQKLESAWKTYAKSLRMLPQQNATVLHTIRLLWQVVQRMWTKKLFNCNGEVTETNCFLLLLCNSNKN